jgi:hypothetical protein
MLVVFFSFQWNVGGMKYWKKKLNVEIIIPIFHFKHFVISVSLLTLI